MDLSEPEFAVVAAVASGEKAWSSLKALARDGHDEGIISGLMPDPDPLRNILAAWRHPEDGECVTLTPWGAHVWARIKDETLELGERPITIKRGKRKSKIPLTEKQKQQQAEMRRFAARAPYWIEGNIADQPKGRRGRLKETKDPLPELVRAREPEFMRDDQTDEEIELFTKLFDGTKVQGIKIKIDPKLKGAKGKPKGGAKQPKARRRAG